MGSRIKGKELRSKVMAGSEGSGHGVKSELGGVGLESERVTEWGLGASAGVWTESGQGPGFSLKGVDAVPPVHRMQHFSVNPERDGATEQQQSHVGCHRHDAKVQEAQQRDHEACEDHS